jgi:uncharacterized protein HemX
MQFNSSWQQLSGPSSGASRVQSVLFRVLAVVAGLVMAAVSLVAFAVLAVVGIAVGAYFWWKTRHVREQLRQAQQAQQAQWRDVEAARSAAEREDSTIIEGEVVSVEVSDVDMQKRSHAGR